MGHFLDGKASLVIGTHTHVPTADWRILSGGTAFMTDVGMCGDYDSVIGMEKDEPLRRATTKIPSAALRAGARPGDAVRAGGGDRRRDGPRAPRRAAAHRARASRRPSRTSETAHERSRPSCTAAASAARSGFAASGRAVPGVLVPLQGLPPADRRAGGRVGRLPRRIRWRSRARRSAAAPRSTSSAPSAPNAARR